MSNKPTNYNIPALAKMQSRESIEQVLLTIISSAYQMAGFRSATPQDYAFDANALLNELKNFPYNQLTEEEIRFAFKEGALERYGEYKGANMRTYIKWLDSYLDSDERKDFVKLKQQYTPQARQLTESTEELTQEDQDRIMKEDINEAYFEFCQNKSGITKPPPIKGSIGAILGQSSKMNNIMFKVRSDFLIRKGVMKPNQNLNDFFEEQYNNNKKTIFDI